MDKTRAIKIMITIPFILETMQELIIESRRRSLGLWCRKIYKKNSKIIKKNMRIFLKECLNLLY